MSSIQRQLLGRVRATLITFAAVALAACGGGSVDTGDDLAAAQEKGGDTYTVGGTVTFSAAATDTVTLRVTAGNGSFEDLTVNNTFPSVTSFKFVKRFRDDARYSVQVANATNYLCTLTGGRASGVIDDRNVTNLAFFCQYIPVPTLKPEFTVFGVPEGATLTAAYFNLFTDEVVSKTFTIGATDGATYAFDESFAQGVNLQFGVTASPAGYTCLSNSMVLLVDVLEPVVTCTANP